MLVTFIAATHFKWVKIELKELQSIQLHDAVDTPDNILRANQQYLKNVENNGLDDLFLLAEISSVLNVIETSEVGVSLIANFEVTLGSLLKDLNDGLSKAMQINTGALVAVQVMIMLSQFAHFLSPFLLWLCILAFVIFLAGKQLNKIQWINLQTVNILHMFARRSAILFLIAHILIPYSIHASSLIANQINAISQASTQEQLSNLHGSLKTINVEEKLKSRAESSVGQLKSMRPNDIHKHTENLMTYIFWTLALMLFNLFIMPILILYSLFVILRAMIPVPNNLHWKT